MINIFQKFYPLYPNQGFAMKRNSQKLYIPHEN